MIPFPTYPYGIHINPYIFAKISEVLIWLSRWGWKSEGVDGNPADGQLSLRTIQFVKPAKLYRTRQNYRNTKMVKNPVFPGNPQLANKNQSEDHWCPGILSCPGQKVSIIKVSIILFVTAKREFFPFFAGIASYRKPAAVKRRAFHNDGIIMKRQQN